MEERKVSERGGEKRESERGGGRHQNGEKIDWDGEKVRLNGEKTLRRQTNRK